MKLIRVVACKSCPNLALKWNDTKRGYTSYACRKIRTTEDEDIIEDINTIPNWCLLPEDVSLQQKQLGNAVCPPVAKVIAEHLKELL